MNIYMNNKIKILIIILTITICSLACIFAKILNPTIEAVVVKVEENNLTLMDVKDEGLYRITMPTTNNMQFKQGQEILLYLNYDAIIELTNPASINSRDIKKIRILKEKSNVEVSNKNLERIYNSGDNILISIEEISTTGMTMKIKDTNIIKHEYENSNTYEISKRNGNTYRELTGNASIQKNINSVKVDDDTVRNNYNWENVYGKLESGEYKLTTYTLDHYINIFIFFTIDENGIITHSKTECGLIF